MAQDPITLLIEHGEEHGCVHMTELHEIVARAPTDEEVAQRSKLPLKQVREVRAAARAVASLDKPVGDDDSAVFGDLFAAQGRTPDEEVEVELTEKAVR